MARVLSQRKKKNLSVNIHPSALPAFEFYQEQSFLFDPNILSPSALSLMNKHQIFQGTHPSEKQYFIFSGFTTLNFSLNTFNIKDATVLTYSNLSDSEIKEIAWLSVCRTFLSSLQNKRLEIFRIALNQSVPKDVIHSLFNSSPLTQSLLSEHTHLSISGLKKQNKEIEDISNIQIVDIFESLKGVYDER